MMMKKKLEILSMDEGNRQIAMKVSAVSIAVNVALSMGKLAAGIFGQSAAMVSDAVHSLSDVMSTFVVIIGVRLAGKKPDAEHPFGHDRLECVAALILSGLLFATALFIGMSGLDAVLDDTYRARPLPGTIALAAAAASIVTKEWMYWYTRRAAIAIRSDALMADAWHHRSDSLSSIGAFIGIFGARMGFPILDPLASAVIALFIAKAAFSIFCDAVNKMIDRACDQETEEAMRRLIMDQYGVRRLDALRTRLFGPKMYVEVEIAADATIPLADAHAIAHSVHDEIESRFPLVKHCIVHVNPFPPE